jgi:hypothetical protein
MLRSSFNHVLAPDVNSVRLVSSKAVNVPVIERAVGDAAHEVGMDKITASDSQRGRIFQYYDAPEERIEATAVYDIVESKHERDSEEKPISRAEVAFYQDRPSSAVVQYHDPTMESLTIRSQDSIYIRLPQQSTTDVGQLFSYALMKKLRPTIDTDRLGIVAHVPDGTTEKERRINSHFQSGDDIWERRIFDHALSLGQARIARRGQVILQSGLDSLLETTVKARKQVKERHDLEVKHGKDIEDQAKKLTAALAAYDARFN